MSEAIPLDEVDGRHDHHYMRRLLLLSFLFIGCSSHPMDGSYEAPEDTWAGDVRFNRISIRLDCDGGLANFSTQYYDRAQDFTNRFEREVQVTCGDDGTVTGVDNIGESGSIEFSMQVTPVAATADLVLRTRRGYDGPMLVTEATLQLNRR